MTGGGDRPYALGLANTLISLRIPFDFIASDDLDSPELRKNPLVRFLNLRGDQRTDAPTVTKIRRLTAYYCRLFAYAAASEARIFHILWNNKIESFDRTLLMLYYKLMGKRLVLTAHNINKNKRDGNDKWINRVTLGIQYRLMDHVFVHTELMKRELKADFHVADEKISVIPFGINSTVPDTDMSAEEARRLLGLSLGEKVLLFFGNIAPYKGLEFLVEALLLLSRSGQRYRLIIAGRPKGSESYWEAIRSRIADTELAGTIIQRIEYIPDESTEIYFKAADVLVLPYTHVFQSGVLSLGYNFGLPVIAADVGSLRDDIVEGRTGYLCRSKDPHDLASCIERYFNGEMHSQIAVLRHQIRRHAYDRYSWEKVGSITGNIYKNLNMSFG